METLAHDFAIVHDHAANQWIGAGHANGFSR
jgi:hypothetical protein